MRAQELIQAILQMLDRSEQPEEPETVVVTTDPQEIENPYDDEVRRMKQIAGLLDPGEMSPLSNSPNPQYANVDSVTVDAGGGPNGPKHPADIRTAQTSMYPAHQHTPYKEL